MGFVEWLVGRKPQPAGGVRMVPCILCGKKIPVRPSALTNKFFYPLTGKHYACCSGGCDGKGVIDSHKIWSRIAALPESQRAASDVSDIG